MVAKLVDGHEMGMKRNNDPWVPLSESPSLQLELQNPVYQMIDSERYIRSLERKLAKLSKSQGKEPTSRDIITSLALCRDDQMRRYVSEYPDCDFSLAGSSTADEPVPQASFVQRKLHPERQILNAEEIAELVREDILAKTFEELMNCEDISSVQSRLSSSSGSPATYDQHNQVCSDQGKQINPSEDVSVSSGTVDENWANFDEVNENTDS